MNMDSRYLDAAFNHTAVGTYSSKLNPMDAGHTYTIGPAIDLEVSPGDTVRMEVFAQYITPISDVNDVVTAMASAIAGSFGFISPLGESAALADAVGTALAGGAAVPNIDRQGAPKAYIQYIVFNKNMTMAQHGYSMVTDDALANWQKLELEVPIEENGYIYIYVANESKENVDVYFDDLEVQLIDAPVTGASDYYPFGLAMTGRSYSSEKYRFGYQGQFAEIDEETGWNAFELRMYEPIIGRWMSIDPYGQFASPYLSMGNNPTYFIDRNGGCVGDDCADGNVKRDNNWDDNFEAYVLEGVEVSAFKKLDGIFGRVVTTWENRGYSIYDRSTNMGKSIIPPISYFGLHSFPDYIGISLTTSGQIGSFGGTIGLSYINATENSFGEKEALYLNVGPGIGVDFSVSFKFHWGYYKHNNVSIDDFNGIANSWSGGIGILSGSVESNQHDYAGYGLGIGFSPYLKLRGGGVGNAMYSIPIFKK